MVPTVEPTTAILLSALLIGFIKAKTAGFVPPFFELFRWKLARRCQDNAGIRSSQPVPRPASEEI